MSTAEAASREKVRDRVLFVVVLTVFLDLVGFGITIPLLPFYVKPMVSEEWAGIITGLLISSYSFAQALATPVLGRLSDRMGRRSVIVLSLAGNAASMVLFAAAVNFQVLWCLFVSRLLAGATAGNLAACQAAIADVTEKHERAPAMGRLGAGIGLGMIMGPVIGGVTAKIALWAPPIAAAVMALADLVLAAALMPETRPVREPERAGHDAYRGPTRDERRREPSFAEIVADKRVATVLQMYFLTFMAMTVLNVAFPLLSHDRFGWTAEQVGYMFAIFGVSGVVIQGFLIKRLSARFSELGLVETAAALMLVGMLCAAFSTQPWMMVLANVLIGVGVAINNPSISSLASKYAREDQRGTVLGYAQSTGSWARTIWPATWGFMYNRVAPISPFLGAAAGAALLLGVALVLHKQDAPASEQG
ncbi:MFS transporter [Polyangium sorediatum]|uniref:MFS transporter n=1 Tax=Polyangium sorediatum TaxID=889274 RepID=A0ABT6P530_9BACT|nr:MFS transporter [Polyangium sorediatum]MDI1435717.1 MFS transporter [Polyangium sorediatum]